MPGIKKLLKSFVHLLLYFFPSIYLHNIKHKKYNVSELYALDLVLPQLIHNASPSKNSCGKHSEISIFK